ncbi:hypothetical protein CCACVL1_24124 [Corchorus capsularis]|uniref:Uncharacterized protein n=1 Tax=Corchorus capsularis TaxID=210143 RepID=A0A1R3GQS5_COCAP|nr:hypothetical protein CCACVL1_24124 [Corchorus capsularis]
MSSCGRHKTRNVFIPSVILPSTRVPFPIKKKICPICRQLRPDSTIDILTNLIFSKNSPTHLNRNYVNAMHQLNTTHVTANCHDGCLGVVEFCRRCGATTNVSIPQGSFGTTEKLALTIPGRGIFS